MINHEFSAILLARQVWHDVCYEIKCLILAEVAEHAEDRLSDDKREFTFTFRICAKQVLLTDLLARDVRQEHERMLDCLFLYVLLAF